MELHIAIRELIDSYGIDYLCNEQIVNALDDFHVFNENPAERNVMRILIQEGYAKRILNSGGRTLE